MREDHQRTKSGKYGIVSGYRDNEYLLVEVLQRDDNGNVLRMRRNTLSSGTKEHCQSIIDKFERNADLEIVGSFETWQKGQKR